MNHPFFNLSHLKKTNPKTHVVLRQRVFTHPSYFFATGFGFGLFPKAPGTIASFIALLLYFPLHHLSILNYSIFLILMTMAAIYTSEKVSKEINYHDDPSLCIDEFIGCWVTLFLIPAIPWLCFLGFLLFRFFDIVKPFPIRYLDRHIHGGFGMVFDDIVAGLFSNLILQIILYFFIQ